MLKFIEKNKIFWLVVFALMMLTIGVSFWSPKDNLNVGGIAAEGEFSVILKAEALWENAKYTKTNVNPHVVWVIDPSTGNLIEITYTKAPIYRTSHGADYEMSVGSVFGSASIAVYNKIITGAISNVNNASGSVSADSQQWLQDKEIKCDDADKIGAWADISVSFASTPASGFRLKSKSLTISGTGMRQETLENTASYTFSDVEEDSTVYATFTAVFEPQSYNIVYYANGGLFADGSTSTTKDSIYLEYYNSPTAPTRPGYDFEGWFTAATGGTEKIGFTDVSQKALYAHWKPTTYTATLNYNGGQDSNRRTQSSVAATYASTMPTLSEAQIPTKVGHAFGGFWSEDEKTQYYDKDGKGLCLYNHTSNSTIYAKWLKISFRIIFDDIGSQEVIYRPADWTSWKYPPTITNITKVSSLSSSQIPTKTGYAFTGWWTAESGGTMIFDATGNPQKNTTYIDIAGFWNVSSDLTVYAQWTEHTYKIIFNKNSTEASGTMNDMSLSYTESKALTTNAYTRTGYTFSGWATSDSGAVVYSDRATVSGLTSTNGGIVNLYAVWSENSYTIAFNNNGGSGTITSKTLTYTESWTLTTNTFTKAGYLYEKWNSKSDGTGSNYLDGASVSKLSSINGATVTLYAKWQATWATDVATPSGSGTLAEPYEISSAKNLAWIASQTTGTTAFNKHCKQIGNISLSGKVWLPIGTSSAKFTGSYDGNGYVITNINSSTVKNASDNYIYSQIGLFGYTSGATINRVTILSSTMYGHNQVGVLVGSANDSTKISMCQTKGTVTSSGQYAGGIVANLSSSSSLTKSVSSATVNGGKNAGGLVGYAGSVTITSSGFTGTVSGTDCALLVGYASKDYSAGPTITDCFAHGTGSTSFYKGSGVNSIKSCLYSSGTTKKYYDGEFAGWVKIGSTTIPKDLAWITSIGESTAKATIINGYSKV